MYICKWWLLKERILIALLMEDVKADLVTIYCLVNFNQLILLHAKNLGSSVAIGEQMFMQSATQQ